MTDITMANSGGKLNNALEKQFAKSFFENLDIRFIVILCCSLLLQAILVLYLSQKPVDTYTEKEIARMQERFATFVLRETQPALRPEAVDAGAGRSAGESGEAEEAAPPENEASGSERAEEGRVESAADRQAARMASASAQREALSESVANKGLLRLLTGTGESARGSAVAGFLDEYGDGRTSENLDEILSSSEGLRTRGESSLNASGGAGNGVRGGRSGRHATIDDLVTDLGQTQSHSLERQGDLAVETPADVAGRGSVSVNRSPAEIQRVIMGHQNAIRYCFERELRRYPDLEGKITVRITVNSDGHVSDVVIVDSTLDNERAERCILARIRLWRDFKPIGKDQGDIVFQQTFTFLGD